MHLRKNLRLNLRIHTTNWDTALDAILQDKYNQGNILTKYKNIYSKNMLITMVLSYRNIQEYQLTVHVHIQGPLELSRAGYVDWME